MTRFTLTLIVLMAATLFLQSCSDSVTDAGEAGEFKLVFTSRVGPESTITIVDADGTDLRRLTTGGFYIHPVVSPKGDMIAYQSVAGIHLMNIDGTNQRLVGAEGATPSWSPDGTKLIYTINRNNNPDIWMVNADGSGERRLTTDQGRDFHPFWSPDGRMIAFLSDRDQSDEERLYVMNADGTGQRRVSSDVVADLERSTPWAPEGTRLVFTGEPSPSSSRRQVYIVNLDGSGQKKLTDFDGDGAGDPCWSPDGLSIAFAADEISEANIFAISPNGSNLRRITSTDAEQIWYPTWSPDGRHIAFTQNGIIRVINADGSGLYQLPSTTAFDDEDPLWSPVRIR